MCTLGTQSFLLGLKKLDKKILALLEMSYLIKSRALKSREIECVTETHEAIERLSRLKSWSLMYLSMVFVMNLMLEIITSCTVTWIDSFCD